MSEEVDKEIEEGQAEARRAEFFTRAVLAGKQDAHGRNLLVHAERSAGRAPMHWEKEIAWLAAALAADGVDETMLTAIGFGYEEVRHATIVQPQESESALAYAKRLAAYKAPEAFAVGEAILAEPASTNTAIPPETTDAERDEAIGRLRNGMQRWSNEHRGRRPPRGGSADDAPTAPGLAAGLGRLRHHTRMGMKSLHEMRRGPGNTLWGIGERLDQTDLDSYMTAAVETIHIAAAVVIDAARMAKTPATPEQVKALESACRTGIRPLAAIELVAGAIKQITEGIRAAANRRGPDKKVH